MSELPDGWAKACIGDVASVQLGKMLDRAKQTRGTYLQYLRNANVRWGSFDLTDLLEMPFEGEELERFDIRRGDLFVCEGGEPGRCAVWTDPDSDELKFQKALLRIRPATGIDPRWIMYALQLSTQTGELESYFTGSTIKHFPREAAIRFRFSVSPLPEQHRILEKVEKLLDVVSAALARVGKAAAVLGLHVTQRGVDSRVHHAILAQAFAGELVPTEAELARREGRSYEPASVLLDRIRAEARNAPARTPRKREKGQSRQPRRAVSSSDKRKS